MLSSMFECIFSKMKLIKQLYKTIMADERLEDFYILWMEHDFRICFEVVIDQFLVKYTIRSRVHWCSICIFFLITMNKICEIVCCFRCIVRID